MFSINKFIDKVLFSVMNATTFGIGEKIAGEYRSKGSKKAGDLLDKRYGDVAGDVDKRWGDVKGDYDKELGKGERRFDPYLKAGERGLAEYEKRLAGYDPQSLKEFGGVSEEQMKADPGYQFRRDQGLQAQERTASRMGGRFSGGLLAGMEEFSQGLASQEYGNVYQRAMGEHNLANQSIMYDNQNALKGIGLYGNMAGMGMAAAGQMNQFASGMFGSMAGAAGGFADTAAKYRGMAAEGKAAGIMGDVNAKADTWDKMHEEGMNWMGMGMGGGMGGGGGGKAATAQPTYGGGPGGGGSGGRVYAGGSNPSSGGGYGTGGGGSGLGWGGAMQGLGAMGGMMG